MDNRLLIALLLIAAGITGAAMRDVFTRPGTQEMIKPPELTLYPIPVGHGHLCTPDCDAHDPTTPSTSHTSASSGWIADEIDFVAPGPAGR